MLVSARDGHPDQFKLPGLAVGQNVVWWCHLPSGDITEAPFLSLLATDNLYTQQTSTILDDLWARMYRVGQQ
jgi:hypothetical protein